MIWENFHFIFVFQLWSKLKLSFQDFESEFFYSSASSVSTVVIVKRHLAEPLPSLNGQFILDSITYVDEYFAKNPASVSELF